MLRNRSGVASGSRAMRCSMVGTITMKVIWCLSTSSTTRAASNFSRMKTVSPFSRPGAAKANPLTWYSGEVTSDRGTTPPRTAICWGSSWITPRVGVTMSLGRPVEPDEAVRLIVSDTASGSGSALSDEVAARSARVSTGQGASWVSETVTTGPAASWSRSISRWGMSWRRGSRVAPSFQMARVTRTWSTHDGRARLTTESLPTPWDCSARAIWLARVSSSPNDTPVSVPSAAITVSSTASGRSAASSVRRRP